MSTDRAEPWALRPWSWWVRYSGRLMDARILALLRILVCLCVLLDLLRVWQIGLVEDYYRLYEHGGINDHPDSAAHVVEWFGPDGGIYAYWTTVACMALAVFGIATRPALVLGVLAYAQSGHLYSPGDRGIDRILRTAMIFLIFSGSHRRFALGLLAFPRMARDWVAAWPADLVRWLMVMVYLSAGVSKLMQQPRWLMAPDLPVVYRILSDPMAGKMDPVAAEPFWLLWVIFGWATIIVECSAPILLTRWGRYWSLLALPMHVGIYALMELGMFSFGMMAMHVLLLQAWLIPLMDRVPALRRRQPPPADAVVDLGRGPVLPSGPTAAA